MMKLKQCPACEANVSPAAAVCPKCGQPMKQSGWVGKALKAGGLVGMVIGMLGCMITFAIAKTPETMNPVLLMLSLLLGAGGFVAAIVGRFCD